MDPVNSIPDILEHAFKGHEEVAIFEASFTAGEGSKDTHVHSRRTGHSFIEGFQKHDICFLFAFKWDSLPLLEGSPAKQENILPLKDQQPGFRGQRTCNHSRLHSQKKITGH